VLTLIAHRTSHPRDLDPVLEWMKVHATKEQLEEVHTSIAKLANGEAWVMSPQFLSFFGRVQMRDRETFNSSATPKPGERRVEPKRLAAVDLAALKSRMAETLERAKADDPRELRRQVAELRAQLGRSGGQWEAAAKEAMAELERVKKTKAAPAPKVEVREKPVLKDSQVERLEALGARAEKAIDAFVAAAREVRPAMLQAIEATRNAQPITVQAALAKPERQFSAPPARPAPPSREPTAHGDASVGNSGLRRMLIALAQRPQGLSQKQLGVRAGVSSRSGTFSTYLGKARSNGWAEGREILKITEAGLTALGSYDPLPEGRALADYWVGELGGSGAARMLRALLDAYPAGLTQEALGEAAGKYGDPISHRSGTFSTYIGKLRSLELITGRGELRAAEELIG
jgi:hypothetical protein